MLIDGFTVIAQIINFLILLFLLYRFLYKPILKTIDRRQQHLNSQWQSAHDAEADAKAQAQEHRQAQQELENQRQHILSNAKAEAEETRKAEIQKIREDIETKRQEWQKALQDEQQSILSDIQGQFGTQVITIVHRMLQDLADVDLEQQVIQVFQSKIRNLDDETREAIAQSLNDPEQSIIIQTGFELTEADQNALRQTLQDTHLVNGHPIHFDISPDLIMGIRLQNDAYDLTWNANDYLQALEKSMTTTLSTTAPTVSSNHPTPKDPSPSHPPKNNHPSSQPS